MESRTRTATEGRVEDQGRDAPDPENEGDQEGSAKDPKAKRKGKPRKMRVGEDVTLRRAGSCRAILLDPAQIKSIDQNQVATLKVLGGRNKGQIIKGVKRYNLDDGVGPTDQVLPSWIADDFEVA